MRIQLRNSPSYFLLALHLSVASVCDLTSLPTIIFNIASFLELDGIFILFGYTSSEIIAWLENMSAK